MQFCIGASLLEVRTELMRRTCNRTDLIENGAYYVSCLVPMTFATYIHGRLCYCMLVRRRDRQTQLYEFLYTSVIVYDNQGRYENVRHHLKEFNSFRLFMKIYFCIFYLRLGGLPLVTNLKEEYFFYKYRIGEKFQSYTLLFLMTNGLKRLKIKYFIYVQDLFISIYIYIFYYVLFSLGLSRNLNKKIQKILKIINHSNLLMWVFIIYSLIYLII